MDSPPRQRTGTQRPVCQDVFDEAQDHRVETSTILTWPSPMWLFFLFPKIKSALKGTRFESVDAAKAKAMELMNELPDDGPAALLPTVEDSHGAVQGSGRGVHWGWQHFYCVIVWIRNVLTSVRLFYSHTTYKIQLHVSAPYVGHYQIVQRTY